MFKCKECGTEYKEKPDYCDCGNDEFDEIVSVVTPKETEKVQEEEIIEKPAPAQKSKNSGFIPQVKPRKTFSEQYPAISRFFQSIDPISGIIFLSCLILSVYVLLFAWNVEEAVQTEKEVVVSNKNIPSSIDKFWNNSLPVIKKEVPEKIEEPKIIEEVKKIVQPKTTQLQNVTKPKTTTIALKKITPKPSIIQKVTAPKTQTAPKKQAESKTVKTPAAVTPPTTVQPQVQPKKTEAELAAEKAAAAQKAAQAKQDFVNYKAKLRNTIGRKIDFTQVVGDGGCIVAFKIDSSGKLVSRSFVQQSSNITLNDAVYKAVMATPSFNPPPSAYKNETMNLIIKFYNGNYEITLR